MRTIIAAAAALALTGCAAPAEAPAPTVTITAPAPEPAPEPAPAGDLIDWMDAQAPAWRIYGDVAELQALADTVCAALDKGVTVDEVADIAEDNVGADVGAALIVGAIGLHCPEWMGALDTYVDAL